MVVYRNTPANALAIGWARLPEYCVGDKTLPLVLHDHVAGLFYYVAAV